MLVSIVLSLPLEEIRIAPEYIRAVFILIEIHHVIIPVIFYFQLVFMG